MNFTLKNFITNGIHLGHHKKKRNPLMSLYLLGIRKNIDIININSTIKALQTTLPIITDTVAKNGTILFVTKNKHLIPHITNTFQDYLQPTIIGQWIPGTLTNFNQIKSSKIINKNNTSFALFDLKKLPNLIILLNENNNKFIIQEAKKLQIPIIAITDSNTNPNDITYPIPGNDDSLDAQMFFLHLFTQSIFIGYAKQVLSFKTS